MSVEDLLTAENVMDGKKKNIGICNSRMDHGYIEHMIDPDCIAKKRQNANLEHTAAVRKATQLPRIPLAFRLMYMTVFRHRSVQGIQQ